MAKRYAVIIGDLVASRQNPDRRTLQRRFKAALEALSRSPAVQFVAPPTITQGDEFQAVLHAEEMSDVPILCERVAADLFPDRLRLGVGVGTITTDLSGNPTEMDGPAFHRARTALEGAKQAGRQLVFSTGTGRRDAAANAIAILLEAVRSDWSEIHHRRARLYAELRTVQAVANAERVSKQAVSKTLKRCHLEEVQAATRALQELLKVGQP